MSHLLSPDKIVDVWNSFNNRVYQKTFESLQNTPLGFYFLLFAQSVFGLSLLLNFEWLLSEFTKNGVFGFPVVLVMFPAMSVVFCVGAFRFVFKQLEKIDGYLVLAALSISLCLFVPTYFSFLHIIASIFLGLGLPYALLLLTQRRAFRTQIYSIGLGILVSTIAIIAIGVLFDTNRIGRIGWLVRTERLWLPLVVAAAETYAGISRLRLSGRAFTNYYFSPIAALFPLPISLQTIEKPLYSKELWFKGSVDLLIGAITLCGGWLLSYLGFLEEPRVSGFPYILSKGWLTYLNFFINSFAFVRMASGLARCMGYDIPDGYHFPLLAANPMERWRRWNTYFYVWLRTYIFVPALRKTQSLFVAILLTFGMTSVLHDTIGFLSLFDGYFGVGEVWWVRNSFIFFLCHGLCVYFYIRTQKYWPSDRSLWGWLGVICTHFLMACVHWIMS